MKLQTSSKKQADICFSNTDKRFKAQEHLISIVTTIIISTSQL